jgi:hypothetical protein
MPELPQSGGLLRVVSNSQLDARDKAEAEKRQAEAQARQEQSTTQLAGFIRNRFDVMKRHRDDGGSGWSGRLLKALRVFNGQYDTDKLMQIRQFGGSEVYARVIAMKCRGAHALLRDVYLSPTRPWGLDPPADPDVPQQMVEAITMLVESEAQQAAQEGMPVDVNMMRDRVNQLMDAAKEAARKKARERAKLAEDKLQEILNEGGFYKALAEFVADVPLFPYGVIKGPVVRIAPVVRWVNGQAQTEMKPKLTWQRISPFDIWWSPGASDIESAEVVERARLTRADLNDLLDLPGYNHEAVRTVLTEYGAGGLDDDWDTSDSERAQQENRENPRFNRSGLIACLEYHGNVQGQMLLDWGMDEKQIPDPVRDYFVQAWLIGRYVIKVQLSPSPRKRHPYYITSFEKVPGTPVGNGLPDILEDIEDVCNASLRALVNNLSISSGPQVVINHDRLHSTEDAQQLFPWKRWFTVSDPMGNNTEQPISFFQPNSNAQELLAVYQRFSDMADELSAIPKYLSGDSPGGAGRTAAGLAMLMGNASKILQTVASNIDRDVIDPLLRSLMDMVLMTDETGVLSGDEELKVMGVTVAVQKETQRARQLEFLQLTTNPIDAQIMGPGGRAEVLREVASTIGMDGSRVVPSPQDIKQAQQAPGAPPAQPGTAQGAAAADMTGAAAEAQGSQRGGEATGPTKDMGPRVRLAGGVQ